ncbi:hypothetical protein BGX28_002704 [Mortierella sp. GBA30]|nr:hypothetical protein BGX28_002704 [Mortierella sp. GBA30]
MDIKAFKPAHPSSSPISTSNTKADTDSKKKKPYAKKDASTTSGKGTSKQNIKGERMTFELDDVLRKYSPEQFKTCKAYDVGGVNILNKKPVDSKTALDKIKRRRETHNRVERRRRDCINQLIDELTALLPKEDGDSISKCHRVNVLRTAVAHIQNLTRQNENLNQQLEAIQTGQPMPPPAIITTLAPITDFEEDDDDSRSQRSYLSEASPSLSCSSHAPHSPISPLSAGFFSPSASPKLSESQQAIAPYRFFDFARLDLLWILFRIRTLVLLIIILWTSLDQLFDRTIFIIWSAKSAITGIFPLRAIFAVLALWDLNLT